MEKKEKDINKLTRSTQETETNEFLSKEDQNKTIVDLARKNPKTSSPPHDNVSALINQQYPPILQWPYTPQPTLKQSHLVPRPSLPTQQHQPIVLNQWQIPSFNPQPHQQQNPINHLQHGLPSSPLNQSTTGFWLPPPPGFAGASTTYQPFTRIGTVDTVTGGGGASSRNEPHIPGFLYQGGYSHPIGFPGTWDPSSWWGQAHQTQTPCTYTNPSPFGYFSLPHSSVHDSSIAFRQSNQRGIIRTQAKLSQKHQQMWEAQSSENVQLWASIGQLQAELAANVSRLLKLEAEVSSLKSTMEESACGGAPTGQPLKRGRPRKVASVVDMLPILDESQPRTSGRKLAPCKTQSETKGLNSERESLNMDKEKGCQQKLDTSTVRQDNDGKISNVFADSDEISKLNGSNLTSAFQTQVHRDIPGIQTGGFSRNPTSESKSNANKLKTQKTVFSVLCENSKGINTEVTSNIFRGTMNSGSHGWVSNMISDDSGRNLMDIRSQAFYDNVNVIRQGGKVVPGWSFMNEDASEENEDVMVESGKDDEEEMEDTSSGADEMARAKAQGAYETDRPHLRWD